MNTMRASLLALLLAAALTTPVLAEKGGSQAGDDADAADPAKGGGKGQGGNRTGGNASDGGNASGGASETTQAARDERKAFNDAAKEDREACEALNGTERDACLQGVAEERKAFAEEQHLAFQAAKEEELQGEAPEARLGSFDIANGSFAGRFVEFSWNAGSRCIEDYTVDGVLVFDSICLVGGNGSAEVALAEHGHVVLIGAGHARLRLHDNPGGVIAARADENGSLAFAWNPGLEPALDNGTVRADGPGNFSATLHGDNLTLEGNDSTAEDHATFVAHADNVVLPAVANEHRQAIEDAKAHGHVGAEVTVAGEGDEDVDAEVLDEPLDVDVAHTEDGVRVVLNATGIGPRTVVLNVAPGLVKGDKLNVSYYDEEDGTFVLVPIVEASSAEDVLDPTDDSTPEYWIEHGPDGMQVLVSVNHWSTHAFTVQGLVGDVPPSVLAGALGAVLFVAVAGAGLLRRRR